MNAWRISRHVCAKQLGERNVPHADHETQCPQPALTKAWVGMSPFIHPLSILYQPPPNHPLHLIVHLPLPTPSIYASTHSLIQRRQWHPTPVLLPGKSHGQRSLVGCSPWGHKESDMTEQLHFQFSLSTFMHWRRKWQPTPVFLPGESQGQGSLVGCRLWGCTESDTTEAT